MGYLIFGASGFLGSAIADWLENKQEKLLFPLIFNI